jgi:hypothetical protein
MTYLKPEHFSEYGSQRVQIKYGPYEVPPSHIKNGKINLIDWNATAPCHDCLITSIQADLVYPDGVTANASTGLWLHHVNFINPGKRDITACDADGELIFASGNERSPVDLSVNG